jgi:hypothetical protein
LRPPKKEVEDLIKLINALLKDPKLAKKAALILKDWPKENSD